MFEKKCETLDMLRDIRADIINFAGMGVTKRISPKDVMSIAIIDNKDLILPIRSIEEALKLLKEFE